MKYIMEDNSKPLYGDYYASLKNIAKALFGDEISNVELKPLNYIGVDITTSSILATCPSVKERFSSKGVDYYKDHGYSALDLFIMTCFHFGYQSCLDHDSKVQYYKAAANAMEKMLKKK